MAWVLSDSNWDLVCYSIIVSVGVKLLILLALWSCVTLFSAFVEAYGESYNFFDLYYYHFLSSFFVRLELITGSGGCGFHEYPWIYHVMSDNAYSYRFAFLCYINTFMYVVVSLDVCWTFCEFRWVWYVWIFYIVGCD